MDVVFRPFYIFLLVLWMLAFFVAAYLLRRRKWVSNLSLMGGVVLLVLLAAECTYRWFFRPLPAITQTACGADCFQHDTLLGFKPATPGQWGMLARLPGSDTIAHIPYNIIADSLRRGPRFDHRVAYRATGSGKEAVFLGCSFTFGTNVPDSATLPYQFGKLQNISTINLGCAAYGLHQVYALYNNRYANEDNSHRVFVYSLLSDHFFRAAGMYDWNLTGPYYKLVNDSLVPAGPVHWNINMKFRRAPYYMSFFGSLTLVNDKLDDILLRRRMNAFNKQDYHRIYSMLQAMSRSIAATGGKLIILNWDRSNWGYQGYEFPFQEMLDEDVRKLNAQVVEVSAVLDYNDAANFIPGDGHPAGLANFRLANRLGREVGH